MFHLFVSQRCGVVDLNNFKLHKEANKVDILCGSLLSCLLMDRVNTKKGFLILFLACFYFSSILLGALSTSATSEHMLHQKRLTRHSRACPLACSSMVAQIATSSILPTSLPFFSILLVIVPFLFYQTNTSISRSRAPPRVSF